MLIRTSSDERVEVGCLRVNVRVNKHVAAVERTSIAATCLGFLSK